jgi:hypothetical protein
MMSAKFYVASRASLPERPAMWRDLRARGVEITSTWIDEAGEGETACMIDLWRKIMWEVREATALILYVEPEDFPLKGALIEVGAAMALSKRILVVAPGVELEPRSMRPLGSWAMHPLVTFHDTVKHALQHVYALQSPEGRTA